MSCAVLLESSKEPHNLPDKNTRALPGYYITMKYLQERTRCTTWLLEINIMAEARESRYNIVSASPPLRLISTTADVAAESGINSIPKSQAILIVQGLLTARISGVTR